MGLADWLAAGEGAGTLAGDWVCSGTEGEAGVVIGALTLGGVAGVEDTMAEGTTGEPVGGQEVTGLNLPLQASDKCMLYYVL